MLTYLTTGESHGPQLTAVLDGFPAGLKVDPDQINYQLARRQKGYGRGGRMRIEKDKVRIVSGLRHGLTLGGPITLIIENLDWTNWTEKMDPVAAPPDDVPPISRPRPGHADLPGGVKWGHHDFRNVLERASARETAARVALGSLARQLLSPFGVEFASHVVSIGKVIVTASPDLSDLSRVNEIAEESPVRCLDAEAAAKMIAEIDAAQAAKDTLGGVSEIIVRGLPIGLGGCSQWYHRLDGIIAGALMAVPSVKGVEIGGGFNLAERRGSEVHDQIFYDSQGRTASKLYFRTSNSAGGIEGGMTNGEDLIARVAGKPISTLMQPLATVDVITKKPAEALVERSDTCVTPALGVVCEAVVALVLAEAFLTKFGADNLVETRRNFQAFSDAAY